MSHVSTYLNFSHNTEEAFIFYKSVFGGEFVGGVNRFSDTLAKAIKQNVHFYDGVPLLRYIDSFY